MEENLKRKINQLNDSIRNHPLKRSFSKRNYWDFLKMVRLGDSNFPHRRVGIEGRYACNRTPEGELCYKYKIFPTVIDKIRTAITEYIIDPIFYWKENLRDSFNDFLNKDDPEYSTNWSFMYSTSINEDDNEGPVFIE